MDKHSTGGVGDKTSFLVAPLAAACGVAVPMISGRALGHTGGTLDKLEAIPGYRTSLTLAEFEAVIARCGASIMGQTDQLAPADRKLYALRDRTGTVENPGLICASILSKKLAAGLDALVLDVKTGSGAFLRKVEDCEFLAALMVATAEAAGTRTVALLTDMGQPLGRAAGNWIELAECVELLRGERPGERRFARTVADPGRVDDPSRRQAETPQAGYARAEAALDGWLSAARVPQDGGRAGRRRARLRRSRRLPQPRRDAVVEAWESGFMAEMDTTALGWAVQRTGAGREKAGSRSILMREFYFTRAAARGWSWASRSRQSTRPTDEMLAEPVRVDSGSDQLLQLLRSRAADQQHGARETAKLSCAMLSG